MQRTSIRVATPMTFQKARSFHLIKCVLDNAGLLDSTDDYSNVSRAKRKKRIPQKDEISEINAALLSKEPKSAGSTSFDKHVKQSPLIIPKCQGEMRIITFTDQPDVIKKILGTCGRRLMSLRRNPPANRLPLIQPATS